MSDNTILLPDLDVFPIPKLAGHGTEGVVVQCDGIAVKVAFQKCIKEPLEQLTERRHAIDNDQTAHRFFSKSPSDKINRIVRCIDCPSNAVRMEYMENRDIYSYLQKLLPCRPSKAQQLSWCQQMTEALMQVHDHWYLHADAVIDNFLLDSTLSVKICDFGRSRGFPPGTNMETGASVGRTLRMDIGQLGAAMYCVVAGVRCPFNIKYTGAGVVFPERNELPSTDEIFLGPVIEKCWTRQFRNTRLVLEALKSFESSISDDVLIDSPMDDTEGDTDFPSSSDTDITVPSV